MVVKIRIALFLCCLLMVSLVYSPFLASVSMLGLLGLSLVRVHPAGHSPRVGFNREPFVRFSNYQAHWSYVVIPLYFLIVLFSFWQTTGDASYYLERLRIKLPFLVLPFAFLGLPRFSQRQVNGLLLFLLVFMALNGVGICINYLIHFDEINIRLSKGQPMPTPRNHIRFSLLTAVSIIGGIYLLVQRYIQKKENIASNNSIADFSVSGNGMVQAVSSMAGNIYFIAGLTVFLFVFLHILSVKSGIVCLYFALGVLGLRYIYLSGKILLGTGMLLLLLSLPVVAYYTVPSFNQKIGYVIWDFAQFQEGKGGNYADSGRIKSLVGGYELFRRHPAVGVGAGNIRREMQQLYATEYKDYAQSLAPHNQFLFVLAGTGLFGFALLMVAFWVPLFFQKAYRDVFFLGFYMIFLTAFMLEHTIENAAGVGIFIFFLLLGLGIGNEPTAADHE